MFKYEVVSIEVDHKYIYKVAKEISEEAANRPHARLINQNIIQAPAILGNGSKTKAILLTFETKLDE